MELPADYYAKAVPVLNPRVYRLAKLTNKSDVVLLPGEATVYVSGDFVGRMRMPLVAPGEPFIAGFGVDPQLQVSRLLGSQVSLGSRRETRKSITSSRMGLQKLPGTAQSDFQLWDRLPQAGGRGGRGQPGEDVGRTEQ